MIDLFPPPYLPPSSPYNFFSLPFLPLWLGAIGWKLPSKLLWKFLFCRQFSTCYYLRTYNIFVRSFWGKFIGSSLGSFFGETTIDSSSFLYARQTKEEGKKVGPIEIGYTSARSVFCSWIFLKELQTYEYFWQRCELRPMQNKTTTKNANMI